MKELLLIINGQPTATMLDTPENHMFLATWFDMTYLGENKYKQYKLEKR